MTILYKENGISWALNVLVLIFLFLNPSESNFWNSRIKKLDRTNSNFLLQTQCAIKGSRAYKYHEFGPNFAYYLNGGRVQNHIASNHCANIN